MIINGVYDVIHIALEHVGLKNDIPELLLRVASNFHIPECYAQLVSGIIKVVYGIINQVLSVTFTPVVPVRLIPLEGIMKFYNLVHKTMRTRQVPIQ